MTFHHSRIRTTLALIIAVLGGAAFTPAAHAQFESVQFISEAWPDIHYGPGATLQQIFLRPLHKCADIPPPSATSADDPNASHLDTPATQVNIEARFLLVDDRFARDIGVDWDLGDEDDYDAFFGGDAGDALVAGARAAGLTRDNHVQQNAGTDLETRVGRLFPGSENYTPLPVNYMRISFLEDLDVDLMIRAMQSEQRSTTLTAPRVTFFNGQTASIQTGTQQAFVTSLTPVVGEGGTGFTPNVNVTDQGVVLTVRPVVSADRRYVTLTMQPTIATLLQPITPQVGEGGNPADAIGTVCVTNVAGPQIGFVPVLGRAFVSDSNPAAGTLADTTIALPELKTTQVRTTVAVPDKGTLLLGGQRLATDAEAKDKVPILGDIPILGRLFGSSEATENKRQLIIFITPHIIIQEEEGDNHAKTAAHRRTPAHRTQAFAASDARRLLRDAERAERMHEAHPDAGFDGLATYLRIVALDPGDPSVRMLLQDDAFILTLAGTNATFGLTVPGDTHAGLTEADLNQPARIPARALLPAAAHVADVVNAAVPGVE